MSDYRFRKEERITKKKTIDMLFEGGAKSICIYPIRMVYTESDETSPVSILITVPKRKIKKAVDRNRIKRQIREAYRTQKQELLQVVEGNKRKLIVGFIYVGSQVYSSSIIKEHIDSLLAYLVEKQKQ